MNMKKGKFGRFFRRFQVVILLTLSFQVCEAAFILKKGVYEGSAELRRSSLGVMAIFRFEKGRQIKIHLRGRFADQLQESSDPSAFLRFRLLEDAQFGYGIAELLWAEKLSNRQTSVSIQNSLRRVNRTK